jgi:hypothetical protein
LARFLVLLVTLHWLCPLQAQKFAFGVFLNGDELYSYLTSDDELQRTGAHGYIAGIVDMHVVIVSSYSAPRLFCRPSGLTRERTRDVVKEYLEKHSESRQIFAAEAVTRALGGAYPCPK